MRGVVFGAFSTAGAQATDSAEVRAGCRIEFLGESWQWGAHGKEKLQGAHGKHGRDLFALC